MRLTRELQEFKCLAMRVNEIAKRLPEYLHQELKDCSAGSVEYSELLYLLRLAENYRPMDVVDNLVGFLKQRVEGRLELNCYNRYELDGYEFTCGSYIEVFVDDPDDEDYGWNFGRVEHGGVFGGYYFFNMTGYEHRELEPGMRAAYRV